jgi:hypothetical protein
MTIQDIWADAWASAQPLIIFGAGVIGMLVFSIIVLLLLKLIGKIVGKDIIKIFFR